MLVEKRSLGRVSNSLIENIKIEIKTGYLGLILLVKVS
jgi:hypothetical protein